MRELSLVRRLALVLCMTASIFAHAETPIEGALPKVVKLYGAGGVGRLQGYGSGCLVSADGQILTVASILLEAEPVRVSLADGRRLPAKLLRVDRANGLALLKVDVVGVPFFSLGSSPIDAGSSVLALSNPFNIAVGLEAVTVQRTFVSAVISREGMGDRYLLDGVTSNPGSAGGALVNEAGELVGLLAPEFREPATNTWISLAFVSRDLKRFVDDKTPPTASARKPAPKLASVEAQSRMLARGFRLLPEVRERTPAYVDHLLPKSPAAQAGLRPDDLIVYVGEQLVSSIEDVRREIARLPADDPWKLTVERAGKLVQLTIESRSP